MSRTPRVHDAPPPPATPHKSTRKRQRGLGSQGFRRRTAIKAFAGSSRSLLFTPPSTFAPLSSPPRPSKHLRALIDPQKPPVRLCRGQACRLVEGLGGWAGRGLGFSIFFFHLLPSVHTPPLRFPLASPANKRARSLCEYGINQLLSSITLK